MLHSKNQKVKKSAFAYTMSDAHNNVFGFSQDGYIYTYSAKSNTEGEAWLRMQRTGEKGKKYFLFFADEAEPCAFLDKHNNIYDMDGHYIASLSHARVFVVLLVLLLFILLLSGFALYLGGEAIMEATSPFSDKNTVSIALDDNNRDDTGIKRPDKTHEQNLDIFGTDDEESTNGSIKDILKNTTKKSDSTTKKDNSITDLDEKETTTKNNVTTATTTAANPHGTADLSDLKKKRVIYPGLFGEYQFMVNNIGNVPLFYKLNFMENNRYNIPIRFKLKLGNKYVAGNENTWVTVDELNTIPKRIAVGEEIVYTLEWKWIETNDSHDTQLGTDAVADYEFTVKVDFEEAY